MFGVVFLAEWGDLTQLATASLASNGRAVSVFVGAAAAMVTVAALGVVAGRALLRVVPEQLLRRIAAGIFAVLTIVAVVSVFLTLRAIHLGGHSSWGHVHVRGRGAHLGSGAIATRAPAHADRCRHSRNHR